MEYFTVNEVAERLRVAPLTVRRWIASKALNAVRLSAGRAGWRISADDLEAFLENRREETRREQDESDVKKLAA